MEDAKYVGGQFSLLSICTHCVWHHTVLLAVVQLLVNSLDCKPSLHAS